jgi:hypothetical protein
MPQPTTTDDDKRALAEAERQGAALVAALIEAIKANPPAPPITLAEALVAALGKQLGARLELLSGVHGAKLRHLEARIATIEQRRSLDYLGVWRPDQPYARGDCVTRQGSLFVCRARTEPGDVPGQSDAWQLAAKRGRDGKDARST